MGLFGRKRDSAVKKKKAMDLHQTLSGLQEETMDLSTRIDLKDPRFRSLLEEPVPNGNGD